MPNPNFIRIVMLLDRSGSMASIQETTISSFNQFINALKADNHGYCTLKLVQFDDRYEVPYDGPLDTLSPMTNRKFEPRGMTAYLDACGRAIDELGSELAWMEEYKRPGKVIFCTITDGLENASKSYTHGKVAEMIQHQEEKYSWEFLYLGANHDAMQFANSLNIPQSKVLYYDAHFPETIGSTYTAAANFCNNVRGASVSGQSTGSIAFSDEDRKAAIDPSYQNAQTIKTNEQSAQASNVQSAASTAGSTT